MWWFSSLTLFTSIKPVSEHGTGVSGLWVLGPFGIYQSQLNWKLLLQGFSGRSSGMLWVWVNFLIELIIAFQNWLLVETRHWPAICASKVPDLTHVYFILFWPEVPSVGPFPGTYPGSGSLCPAAQGLEFWLETAAFCCDGLDWNGGMAFGQDRDWLRMESQRGGVWRRNTHGMLIGGLNMFQWHLKS